MSKGPQLATTSSSTVSQPQVPTGATSGEVQITIDGQEQKSQVTATVEQKEKDKALKTPVHMEPVSEARRLELERLFTTIPLFRTTIPFAAFFRSKRPANTAAGFVEDKSRRIYLSSSSSVTQSFVPILTKQKSGLPDDEDQIAWARKKFSPDEEDPISHFKEAIRHFLVYGQWRAGDRRQIRGEVYANSPSILWFLSQYTNDKRPPTRKEFAPLRSEKSMARDILGGEYPTWGRDKMKNMYVMEVDAKASNARVCVDDQGNFFFAWFDRGCTYRDKHDYVFQPQQDTQGRAIEGTTFVPCFDITTKGINTTPNREIDSVGVYKDYSYFGFWWGGEPENAAYAMFFEQSEVIAYQCYRGILENLFIPAELEADLIAYALVNLANALGGEAVLAQILAPETEKEAATRKAKNEAEAAARKVKEEMKEQQEQKDKEDEEVNIPQLVREFILNLFELIGQRKRDFFEAAKYACRANIPFRQYMLTPQAEAELEDLLANIAVFETIIGHNWVKESNFDLNQQRVKFHALRQICVSLPEKPQALITEKKQDTSDSVATATQSKVPLKLNPMREGVVLTPMPARTTVDAPPEQSSESTSRGARETKQLEDRIHTMGMFGGHSREREHKTATPPQTQSAKKGSSKGSSWCDCFRRKKPVLSDEEMGGRELGVREDMTNGAPKAEV